MITNAELKFAIRRQVAGVATEWLKIGQLTGRRWIAHPLNHLPVCGEIDVRIGEYLIDELHKSSSMVG